MRAVGVLERDHRAAGHGIFRAGLDDLGVRLAVRQLRHRLEALEDIAAAEATVGRNDGRVALDARAGLLALRYPPGLLLVLQHVGVAAAITVVDGEGVSREEPGKPGIDGRFLWGQRLRSAEACLADFGRALVVIVLTGPVDSPGRRVGGLLPDLHEPDVRV